MTARSCVVLALLLVGCGGARPETDAAAGPDGGAAVVDAPTASEAAASTDVPDARVGHETAPKGASAVRFTWVGVTTWLVQVDGFALLLDPYFSRAPFGDLGTNAQGSALRDRLLTNAGVERLDAIFVGHAHWDHAYDVGTTALARGGEVYGSQTTCLLAEAQGLPPTRCRRLAGGETLAVGPLDVTVVRLPHSLPNSIGKHSELGAPPRPPLRKATVPVGAQLGFLVVVRGRPAQSFFFYDTFAPIDGDDGSGQDFGANLGRAFQGKAGATVWITAVLQGVFGALDATPAQVKAYLDVVRPRSILAQHFDDPDRTPDQGLLRPFAAPTSWSTAATQVGATLLSPGAPFARFALAADGMLTATTP